MQFREADPAPPCLTTPGNRTAKMLVRLWHSLGQKKGREEEKLRVAAVPTARAIGLPEGRREAGREATMAVGVGEYLSPGIISSYKAHADGGDVSARASQGGNVAGGCTERARQRPG